MTVTVIYGKSSDGYLHNYDANYAAARNGPGDAVNGGNAAYVGQNNVGGGASYAAFQAFVGWDYPAIPDTERVVAASIGVYSLAALAPSIATAIEFRGYPWSGGGLLTSDWVSIATINGARLDAIMSGVNAITGRMLFAGSDELRDAMYVAVSMEDVVVTDRYRNGTIAAGADEAISIAMADASGTSFDPQLVYTSVERSTLFGVLGAQVQISDGSWAYLDSDGAVSPTITLKHETAGGTITTVATLPIGTAATDFGTPLGAQNFALAVDPSDNLYVFGRAGNAKNNLAAKAYAKGSGHLWTAQTLRAAAMPSSPTNINNVAVAYHATAGGTFMVLAGHGSGPGAFTSTPVGVTHAAISAAHVLTGAGSMVTHSGYSMGTLFPSTSSWMSNANETGTGLDAAAADSWGYAYSFAHSQHLAANEYLHAARYILNPTATGLTHASWQEAIGYASKDAGSKLRVVPVSSTAAVFVSADADSSWGLTLNVQQHSGTTPGSVTLAHVTLADEGIADMPDGPEVAGVSTWDALYSASENRLWIYYVSSAAPDLLLRTSLNLTTMQADLNSITVYDDPGGATIQAIRVQRNRGIEGNALVSIATLDGSTRALVTHLDTFNLAPTAPTLTARANYDATNAATFAWTFNDPNPGDTQSAYQLIIERTDTGEVALDTGKVASTTASRNVTGSTLTNGLSYRWRVRTYDALDAVSPYSDYGTFSTSSGGTVTITDPVADNPAGVITDDCLIAWSVAGTTQAAYRVWLYRAGELVNDSGWVASTDATYTVTDMTSDAEHTIEVQVRNGAAVVSGIGSRLITPSYASPEAPAITVSPNSAGGFIVVTVNNPPPGLPSLGGTEYDFEVAGEEGDFTATGGTVGQSAAQAHRAANSMLLTTTGTPTSTSALTTAGAAVVAGERYTVRVWVRCSVARNVTGVIEWRDGGGGVLSQSTAVVAVLADTWTPVLATSTAPAGAVTAGYGVALDSSPATGTLLYVDELALTSASDRPEVAVNEILRREAGDTGRWEVLGTASPDGIFTDYTAGSGVTYEYRARGQA